MTFVIKVMTANSLLFTFSIGHEEQIIGSYSFSKKKISLPELPISPFLSSLVYFMLHALM